MLWWGCASFPAWVKQKPVVAEARPEMAPEEIRQALSTNWGVLSSHKEALGDRAIYENGLMLSHPHNPDRDLTAAIDGFRKVPREFPESRLQNHAGMWVLILKELEEERIKEAELKQRLETRMREREKTIRSLEVRLGKLNNELKGLKAENKQMQDLIQQLESEKQQIREQFEKMKEIDLGIQEKKTEVFRK